MERSVESNPNRQSVSKGRTGTHVCPWWAGYLLASPLRRLFENPDRLLAPHVRDGMAALDFGCAMGYWSLPLARRVGSGGRVVCVDVQDRMLRGLRRRARRQGLESILETRLCTQEDPGIDDLRDGIDIAVAFHVLHETRDPARVVGAIATALRPGGRLLLAEPVGHVSHETLEWVFGLPPAAGLVPLDGHVRRRSRLGVFERPD